MIECTHEKATWRGVFSLVGCYVCDSCLQELDPVEYHKIRGTPHMELSGEYNRKAYEKLGMTPPNWVLRKILEETK